MPPDAAFHRGLLIVTAVLAFCVVALGAWVRLNAAGLGCPDWPACYGHLSAEARRATPPASTPSTRRSR